MGGRVPRTGGKGRKVTEVSYNYVICFLLSCLFLEILRCNSEFSLSGGQKYYLYMVLNNSYSENVRLHYEERCWDYSKV